VTPYEAINADGPWTHRLVPANGAQFHVVEAGRGPLVVLLHGFPQFWWTWREYLPALASAGYRAAAMDLRDSKSRRRFKMRLQATMHLARVMGHTQAAIELQRLDTTIAEAELGEPRSAAVIDRFLGNVAAMAAD